MAVVSSLYNPFFSSFTHRTATATMMPYGLCILSSLLIDPMAFVQRLDPSTTLATVDLRHSMPSVILLGLPIDTSVLGVPFGIWSFENHHEPRQRRSQPLAHGCQDAVAMAENHRA